MNPFIVNMFRHCVGLLQGRIEKENMFYQKGWQCLQNEENECIQGYIGHDWWKMDIKYEMK